MGLQLPKIKISAPKLSLPAIKVPALPKIAAPTLKAPTIKLPSSLHKASADLKKLAAQIVPPKKSETRTAVVQAPAVAAPVSRPQVTSVVQAPALTPAVVKDKTTVVAVPGLPLVTGKKDKVKGVDFPLLNGDDGEMGYATRGWLTRRAQAIRKQQLSGEDGEMGYATRGWMTRRAQALRRQGAMGFTRPVKFSRYSRQRRFSGHEDEMGFDDSMGFDFAALTADLKKQVGAELDKAKAKLTTDVKARAGELVANAANKVLANPEIQTAMVAQGKEAAVKNIAENIASQITTQSAKTIETVKQYSKPIMIGGGALGLLLAWKMFGPKRKAA